MTNEVRKKVIESLYFAIKRAAKIKENIGLELINRGFNENRIGLINDKAAYQQLSEEEIILLAYVCDKYKITNNVFSMCSGFDVVWKDIDYRILEPETEIYSKYALCDCFEVDSYIIGFISIGLLEEAIQKQIVKLPIPPEKVLPVYSLRTINPQNAQVVKIYTLSNISIIDNKIDLNKIKSTMEFDSIFNYLVIKNNLNRNTVIPIIIANNIDNNIDSSLYKYNATLKKIALNDVIKLCTQKTIDKYNLINNLKFSNIIIKIIKLINEYSYDEKIQKIAEILNRENTIVQDSLLLKVFKEELSV